MYRERLKTVIERYDRRVKAALFAVSFATLSLLSYAAYRENFLPEWRAHQVAYRAVLEAKAGNDAERKVAEDFPIELRQLVVPELAAVDRCVSCHLGVDDPRMADRPLPYAVHPGSLLTTHDPARFGCTSCHGGQGRATEANAAHGRVAHWGRPLIEKTFLHSSCSACHADADLLAEGERELPAPTIAAELQGSALLARGKRLFQEKGCLGCHSYRGKGGTLGPDLTYVGDKSRHDFDFSRFEATEPRTVERWLEKHFLRPEEISPGTLMPPLDVGPRDVAALTTYMLSLKRKTVPASHRPAGAAAGSLEPASGAELYGMLCSACHGKDGRESEVPGLRTPALNNADALAVAGDDYLRSVIDLGRSRTAMPAWGESGAGLSRGAIDRLVAHVRGWEPTGPDLRGISSRRGDPRHGRSLYLGNCAGCHGDRGQGGIGNALNAATFLALASDELLARTIVEGRPGTAMPSWRRLSEGEVSDLLAYVRSWEPAPPEEEEILELSATLDGAEEIGQGVYRAHCSTCHGARGEGGIGVSLGSEDFLARVDRRYLLRALTGGRPGTAMPRWNHLTSEQLAGVIAYVDGWQRGPEIAEESGLARGDWQSGELTYRRACLSCHGPSAQGGTGPEIANPAFLAQASDPQLYAWIGRGKVGTAMRGFLAEAQGVATLTPGQILDVIAYLRYLATSPERSPARHGTGDAARGRELYRESCSSCHGRDGEGASGPQLNNAVFLESASDGFLAATMVLGRSGTAMRSMLHGQEGLGQVSAADVDDIVAFLRTWSHPSTWRRSRPAAPMTPEDVRSGGVAYAMYCAGCHGPNGLGAAEGGEYLAPALKNREFLAAASDGFLLATIARGRRGTPMRPFSRGAGGIAELDAEEIHDLVSFIRSWQEDFVTAPPLAALAGSQVPPAGAAGAQQGGDR